MKTEASQVNMSVICPQGERRDITVAGIVIYNATGVMLDAVTGWGGDGMVVKGAQNSVSLKRIAENTPGGCVNDLKHFQKCFEDYKDRFGVDYFAIIAGDGGAFPSYEAVIRVVTPLIVVPDTFTAFVPDPMAWDIVGPICAAHGALEALSQILTPNNIAAYISERTRMGWRPQSFHPSVDTSIEPESAQPITGNVVTTASATSARFAGAPKVITAGLR